MTFINGLLQRLLFTFGVMLFMQLPQFIDHYSQQFSGYYLAQQTQLQQFQFIADTNFSGQLDTLIADFDASPAPAVQQVGKQVFTLQQSLPLLAADLAILTDGSYVNKLGYFITRVDSKLAENTLSLYTPGIPLSQAAIVTGLIGGVSLNLCWLLSLKLLSVIFFRLRLLTNKTTNKPA
ncbi:DUF2937 family protein [Moritella sp. Urea-trap-13]|uniref:DUF2937 family protein n=1 Tax=Moritella sp. Urea-trap-13 TaxID=2058327 RepID=UPI000C337D03|nr:DUF2937 family protein [Moritella sp. Urea-trap-13]PKH09676.1 DUF2937 domain-containing protein [Moritella sp. Urea-trap-13]